MIAAVRQATTKIPVVMAVSFDPVGSGFIASLARPAGNITGLTNDPGPEIVGKLVEFLKVALPKASRVAILWNPVPPGADIYREQAEGAARRLGLTTVTVGVRGRDEFESAFSAMARERADAVVVIPDPVTFTARAQLALLAAKYRLPVVGTRREDAEAGWLISYGSSVAQQFRRTAVYVDKILKGARPGDLPVEQQATFELVINLKTAKALGITVPRSLLLRADHVIE